MTGDYNYDLGSFHRPVSTDKEEAQTWFNRGLVWSYGFNHEESVKCFEQGFKVDPKCAILYWGVAYSLGPNYNKPWEFFDEQELGTIVERAHDAVQQAKNNAGWATPVEQALIEALQYRYPQQTPAKDCSIWNKGYAEAMEGVYQKFPSDLDVATLYADSLMNLTPWALWDINTGKPAADARTMDVKRILETALAQEGGKHHPGILHLYIHLMEMSNTPETAMTAADYLRGLIPDAGHLQHMPTHLDILCGDYRRAISSNSAAVEADERFLARSGPMNFYTLYRCHNYHFRVYAAMFAGQFEVALTTVKQLESTLPVDLLRVPSPPMADWLESFNTLRMHVLIRFGRWQDVLDLQIPEDQDLYCVTTAMTYYAKGIAFAVTGKIIEAEEQKDLLHSAVGRVKPSRTLFNNTCTDILAIAEAMLNGELEYRKSNFDAAFEIFRAAIKLEDSLPYDEPWGWMQPVRHAYGALLLEQGHVEMAADIYRSDLGMDDSLPRPFQHPNNVWTLHGYHECLLKMGKISEARAIWPQLRLALATADVPIESSCFCRVHSIHEHAEQTKREDNCC